MENKKWYKLLSREGVDFMTISMVDTVFYYEIWKMQKCEGELFFTDIYNKNFTHYIGAEPQALGKYLLKKYFNSRKKLEKAFYKFIFFAIILPT